MVWDDILTESKQTGFQPTQVFQEHMQKAIVAYLSKQNAFNSVVFQGGTALRLFYGNPRFSEDLDFVLYQPNSLVRFSELLTKIQPGVESLFPFIEKIRFRAQKKDAAIERWVLTTDAQDSTQRIRLHIELAYVPAHTSDVKILSFPPLNPAVRVETAEEILADKLLALGCREYIKGRDLWDSYFLLQEKSVIPSWNLVWRKTKDYGTTVSTVKKQLLRVKTEVEDAGITILSHELQRFLPASVFSTYHDRFDLIISAVVHALERGVSTGVSYEG